MKKLALAALGLLAVLAFNGCDTEVAIEFSFVTDVDGKVFDARTAAAIPGATVSFKNASGTVVDSAVTDSSGSYSISELTQGTYTIETSLTNYAFGPIQMEVAGESKTIPNIMGFSLVGLAPDTITIVTTWDGAVVSDVDAAVTIPPEGLTGSDTFKAYGAIGEDNFSPDETTVSGRSLVDYNDVGQSSVRGVVIDIDAKLENLGQKPRIETISLPGALTGSGGQTLNSLGGYSTPLMVGDTWRGVLQFYVDGSNGDLVTTDGGSASVKVYVFQDDIVLGVFDLPSFTKIERASVLRIHAFDWGYMIFPELKAVLPTSYRSLDKPFIVTKRVK